MKANLLVKPKEKLDLTTPLLFNRCIISIDKGSIALRQKDQGKKINVVDIESLKQGYVEQRAHGAYVAFIC